MVGVIVVVWASFGLAVSEAKTEIMCLRTKGTPESTAIFSVEAADQVYVGIFLKLHITAQSGPVIRVILCHSH